MTSENSKQSEILMKLNLRSESHEGGHEGTECVEADAQCPPTTQTPKRGNENQPAEDNSNPHQSISTFGFLTYNHENANSLKAKEVELRKEICTLPSLRKKSAKSCMELKKENYDLLTSSESSDESNSSPDCYSDDEEGDDSDSLAPMLIIKE
ncbi:hypothetical protein H5410_010227 [Solanum commersonii]|uniref:Uncharacterized protein n=1 Tax=Solanum commersonii TaxID=4109 RepID=A0A9J6AKR8_SOLCO|nr:hypothetical protein H5410_010227 [Solanum commersonii]